MIRTKEDEGGKEIKEREEEGRWKTRRHQPATEVVEDNRGGLRGGGPGFVAGPGFPSHVGPRPGLGGQNKGGALSSAVSGCGWVIVMATRKHHIKQKLRRLFPKSYQIISDYFHSRYSGGR